MRQLKNNSTKNKYNSKKIILISFMVLVILLCSFSVAMTNETFAKYITGVQEGIGMMAKSFYFYSDVLTEAGANRTESSFKASTSATAISSTAPTDGNYIVIDVQNYTNEFRITNADIEYSISAYLYNAEGEISETAFYTAEYDFKADVKDEDLFYLSVFEDDFYDGEAKVKIEAISSTPYAKAISCVYTVVQSSDMTVSAEITTPSSETNIEEITITTGSSSGVVHLVLPNDLLFDPTNFTQYESKAVDAANEQTTYVFNMSAYAKYSINFFKADSSIIYDSVGILYPESDNSSEEEFSTDGNLYVYINWTADELSTTKPEAKTNDGGSL